MTYHSKILRTSSAAALCVALASVAYAAGPEAGSVIGNQAVATYTNAAGDTVTVTSNTVETVVQQVAGVTLTSDNSETVAPGGKAFLPHIITNDGNGPDAFNLLVAENDTGPLETSQLVFYPDANMDGVADSATPLLETPVLAPGEQFGVVIEATVPSTNAAGDTDTITVTSGLAAGRDDPVDQHRNADRVERRHHRTGQVVVADASSAGDPSSSTPVTRPIT